MVDDDEENEIANDLNESKAGTSTNLASLTSLTSLTGLKNGRSDFDASAEKNADAAAVKRPQIILPTVGRHKIKSNQIKGSEFKLPFMFSCCFFFLSIGCYQSFYYRRIKSFCLNFFNFKIVFEFHEILTNNLINNPKLQICN